jgi:hypothetical protein
MISTNDQRIYIVPAVGNPTDITLETSEFDSQTATVTLNANVDYLYIGTSLPFNHRWFEVSSANVTAATPSIDIWYANSWKAVVDTLDRTDSSGTPMAQSGNLEFTPDRDFGWDIELDSDDVTELANAPLTYNKYWMRISFDANVSFDLKYVGQKFTNETNLYAKYPVFDSTGLRTSWSSGKTDWDEQLFAASDEVVEDLISRRIIWDRNQILDLATLKNPTIHKCASLIFRGLGANRNPEQLKDAEEKYIHSMDKKQWKVDLNADAQLDPIEKKSSTIFMTR